MNLPISIINVSEDIRRRCIEKGFSTLGKLIYFNREDLVFDHGFTIEESSKLLSNVSKKICPSYRMRNLYQLNEETIKSGKYIETGLKLLDISLGGGIPKGSITEIVGESTIGKTTFCQSLAIQQASFSEVLLIDTEDNRSTMDRMKQMILSRLNEQSRSQEDSRMNSRNSFAMSSRNKNLEEVKRITGNIHVRFIKGSKELVEYLSKLENILDNGNYGLVIIDSIAYPIRKEFEDYIKRAKLLGDCSYYLKKVACNCTIPVVVTNHMTTTGRSNDLFAEKKTTKAALGNTWHHCVSTRLSMRSEKNLMTMMMGNGNSEDNICRVIVIEKSPISGEEKVYYKINDTGIVIDEYHEGNARISNKFEPDRKKLKSSSNSESENSSSSLIQPFPRNLRNLKDLSLDSIGDSEEANKFNY